MQNLIDGVIRELGKKNYYEAIKYCNQLVAQFPKNYIFYEIKGNCNLELGDYPEAIKNYTDAIEYFKLAEGKSNADVASLYNRRGYARLKLKLFEEATKDFHQATDYKPDFAEAYNNCGNAYRKLERYEDALSQCSKAIEYKPDFAEAYNNRGNIHYLFSKADEAIYDYTKAIELKPNYSGAYYNRGTAYYFLQNKIIEAKSDWEKVIKLNPSYEKNLRGKLDKIDEALEQMRKEGEIPIVSEPLSLVKEEEHIPEKMEEVTTGIKETEPIEEHKEPVLEIFDTEKIEIPEEPKIEKPIEELTDKTETVKIEEPQSEKTDITAGTDFEIPDIDFKNMFREEEKELQEVDDLKPLSEIFEQIYQPEVKKDNIIPEEVKQLHKEIEDIPVPPEPKEKKEVKYVEEIIINEGKSKADDIELPWEPNNKEKVNNKATEFKKLMNPSYEEENEKRSIFKSPVFIIPMTFIILVVIAVSIYFIYNKFYERKLQTIKQETTSEQIDTTKQTGNVDSTQIKDTVQEKTATQEGKEKETKDVKTTQEVTMIKNFVVINEKDGIYLQVASLKDKGAAETKAALINKKNVKAQITEADLGSKGKYFRVRIGPFKTIDEAKTAANKIE